eukprot:4474481-Amphidinium_carterae.1
MCLSPLSFKKASACWRSCAGGKEKHVLRRILKNPAPNVAKVLACVTFINPVAPPPNGTVDRPWYSGGWVS